MLKITVPASEQFDTKNNRFVYTKEQTLQLEHSLVSVSKWESKWNKPFLDQRIKTTDEMIDYIRCMTLTQNVDSNIYTALTSALVQQVSDYINAPMTATSFPKTNTPGGREIITAEIIYYWMICHGIPFECQKWHLNRLLTLIKVCDKKSAPPKKMSEREIMNQNWAINQARLKMYNTRG